MFTLSVGVIVTFAYCTALLVNSGYNRVSRRICAFLLTLHIIVVAWLTVVIPGRGVLGGDHIGKRPRRYGKWCGEAVTLIA